MAVWIGTSGWSYDHWHPELYPHGLPGRDRLARYTEAFATAELNSSFYRWPGAGWHELDGRRVVLLVQLAPAQARDDTRLEYFLARVPGWMRVAVEFRHLSWHCEEVLALLAAHRAAYCVMCGARLPCVLRATTDFAYVRMHGPDREHLYAGSYPDEDLRWWGDEDRRMGPGRPGRVRVLQRRRGRERGTQRTDPPGAARSLTGHDAGSGGFRSLPGMPPGSGMMPGMSDAG